jgi:hypothetical protein
VEEGGDEARQQGGAVQRTGVQKKRSGGRVGVEEAMGCRRSEEHEKRVDGNVCRRILWYQVELACHITGSSSHQSHSGKEMGGG